MFEISQLTGDNAVIKFFTQDLGLLRLKNYYLSLKAVEMKYQKELSL